MVLRILTLLLIGSLGALTYLTYGAEHDTRSQQQRIAALEKSITDERDAIAILRAEWSHLNAPERIERLARKHLGLETLGARQIVPLKELKLPPRKPVLSSQPGPVESDTLRALERRASLQR